MSESSIPVFPDLPTAPDEIVARLFDPIERKGDRIRLYHQLRNVAPIHQSSLDQLGRPWLVTRHADAAWVAREKNLIKDERLVDQLKGDGLVVEWR